MREKDKEHGEACRDEFWERADLIASDWPKLEQASHTINRVRSQWTAHLEVEYDSTIKEYRPVDQTSLLEVYQTVEKVVPVITESVSHLAGLLKGLDINPGQWEEIAKREALDFWQISDQPNKSHPSLHFGAARSEDFKTVAPASFQARPIVPQFLKRVSGRRCPPRPGPFK